MALMTSVAAVGLIFYLFLLLLPIALLIALQVWLCKKGRWLGLILPALSLALSLLLTLSLASFGALTWTGGGAVRSGSVPTDEHGNVISSSTLPEDHPHTRHYVMDHGVIAAGAGVFLVSNIPTLVFGGIWLHFKNRSDLREDLRKMRLEDLE